MNKIKRVIFFIVSVPVLTVYAVGYSITTGLIGLLLWLLYLLLMFIYIPVFYFLEMFGYNRLSNKLYKFFKNYGEYITRWLL